MSGNVAEDSMQQFKLNDRGFVRKTSTDVSSQKSCNSTDFSKKSMASQRFSVNDILSPLSHIVNNFAIILMKLSNSKKKINK